jgi:hypothetical protein
MERGEPGACCIIGRMKTGCPDDAGLVPTRILLAVFGIALLVTTTVCLVRWAFVVATYGMLDATNDAPFDGFQVAAWVSACVALVALACLAYGTAERSGPDLHAAGRQLRLAIWLLVFGGVGCVATAPWTIANGSIVVLLLLVGVSIVVLGVRGVVAIVRALRGPMPGERWLSFAIVATGLLFLTWCFANVATVGVQSSGVSRPFAGLATLGSMSAWVASVAGSLVGYVVGYAALRAGWAAPVPRTVDASDGCNVVS